MGGDDPPSHLRGRVGLGPGGVGRLEPVDFDHEIEPVEKRSGNPLAIASDACRPAITGLAPIAGVATRAWVGRPHEVERGWKGGSHTASGHRDRPVFERLAESVEVGSGKLRHLVDEEHAAVS
jgi:hypothetical protein